MARLTRDEIARRLGERGCIFSFFATPREVLADPAAEANGYFMDHPARAGLKIAASPVQFDNQQAQIRRPAPGIGEHSAQVLAEIGYSPDEIAWLIASNVITSAPR